MNTIKKLQQELFEMCDCDLKHYSDLHTYWGFDLRKKEDVKKAITMRTDSDAYKISE